MKAKLLMWSVLIGLGILMFIPQATADEVVGFTHDGLPILQSDIDEAEAEAKAELEYKADGFRQLDINVNLISGLKIKVLNSNSLELYIGDDRYTILVDCVFYQTENKAGLTKVDFFEWQTLTGKITVGTPALVIRNPVKNFGNPKIKEKMKEDNARTQNWDFSPRICTIKAISNIGILFPDALEDVRG